jgi:hypothetical protein
VLTGAGILAVAGSSALPFWEGTAPGAGFYSAILGGVLGTGAALVITIDVLKGRKEILIRGMSKNPPPSSTLLVAGFWFITIVWALALAKAGFLLTSAIGGASLSYLIDPKKPLIAAMVGIIGALLMFGLLSPLLGMRLP